jgi:hypothetical protein
VMGARYGQIRDWRRARMEDEVRSLIFIMFCVRQGVLCM